MWPPLSVRATTARYWMPATSGTTTPLLSAPGRVSPKATGEEILFEASSIVTRQFVVEPGATLSTRTSLAWHRGVQESCGARPEPTVTMTGPVQSEGPCESPQEARLQRAMAGATVATKARGIVLQDVGASEKRRRLTPAHDQRGAAR